MESTKSIKFMSGLLTFYLKGEISVSRNWVGFKIPNTLLGLIPLGCSSHEVPVTDLGYIHRSFYFNFKRFLTGVILFLCALMVYSADNANTLQAKFMVFICGSIFAIPAIFIILNSFWINLSCGAFDVYFLIFEKKKAAEAEALIKQVVSDRLNDTNVRMAAAAHLEGQRQVMADNNEALADAIAGAMKK